MKGIGNNSFRTCNGATLIEVLVTLSILSLGLAGLSAMQLAALEHLRSVVQASRAASFAADMAERLHGGELDDSETVAWRESVGANLSAGAAAVCIDSTPNDGAAGAPACDGAGTEWVIKIWWDENDDGQAERRDITVLRP